PRHCQDAVEPSHPVYNVVPECYAHFFFFFFSSRRRHTRWPRDWSSDVCSSDLLPLWPKTEYVPPLRVTFTKYDKNPWSSTPECDGPVRHPPRRMPTLILKYRPYS